MRIGDGCRQLAHIDGVTEDGEGIEGVHYTARGVSSDDSEGHVTHRCPLTHLSAKYESFRWYNANKGIITIQNTVAGRKTHTLVRGSLGISHSVSVFNKHGPPYLVVGAVGIGHVTRLGSKIYTISLGDMEAVNDEVVELVIIGGDLLSHESVSVHFNGQYHAIRCAAGWI